MLFAVGGFLVTTVFGFLLAWSLVRYEFPGRRIADALVDIPFALPTAVAGLVFSTLYAPNGWLGQFLVPLGIELAANWVRAPARRLTAVWLVPPPPGMIPSDTSVSANLAVEDA